jgi:hypothetical protein
VYAQNIPDSGGTNNVMNSALVVER